MNVIDLLADDQSLITYRPKLNKITKSVTATILLQQTLYWYKNQKYKAFYKFKEPCDHDLYKEGDSWCEELGFTKHEFNGAIKKIGQKLNKKTKKDNSKLIHYWITQDRKTYYEVNLKQLELELNKLYDKPLSDNSEHRKTDNPDLYNTKNTQRPDKENKGCEKKDFHTTNSSKISPFKNITKEIINQFHIDYPENSNEAYIKSFIEKYTSAHKDKTGYATHFKLSNEHVQDILGTITWFIDIGFEYDIPHAEATDEIIELYFATDPIRNYHTLQHMFNKERFGHMLMKLKYIDSYDFYEGDGMANE